MAVNLVGRNDSVRTARALLERDGMVVLAGASGVGKTALARVLTESGRSSGSVAEIRGTHGLKSVPFAALGRFGIGDLAEDGMGHVSNALGLLDQLDEGTPVLVDDAHLLDDASAAVVSEIARSPDTRTVLTVTTGEPVPPDVVALWAEYPQCRIELEPLSRDQVGEMVRGLFGRPVDDHVIDRIAEVTLGYPLYIAALVVEMQQTGLDDISPDSSDRLISLFERRLGRLDRDERRLFDLIAFAESLPVGGFAGGRDLAALDGLEKAELVEVEDDHVRVSHPLLAGVARSTLTREGLRSCATRLVDGMSSDMDESDVAALVRKALAVGVVPKADHLETAARVALQLHDFEGAVRIAAYRPEEPALVGIHARALRYLGEVPDSVPIDLDDESLTEFLSARSQALAYGEGRYREAIDLLVEGMAQLTQQSSRDRIALELVILSGLSGDVETLLGASRAVSDEVDVDTRLLAVSSTLLGEALTLSTNSSAETYGEGEALVRRENPDAFQVERLDMANGLVQLAEGRLFQARSILGRDRADRALEGSWRTIESVLADAWLPIDGALEIAEMATASLQQFDPLGNLSLAQRMVQLRTVQSGIEPDTDVDASADLSQADETMRARIDAWTDWRQDPSLAGHRLAVLGRESVSLGHRLWGLLAFLDAARLGHGDEVVADIEHLVITRGAGLAVPVGRHARAETGGEFWGCARAWWGIGAPTYAIEAALVAARDGNPVHGAGVQLLSHLGAEPLVGDLDSDASPLSDRQTEIVVGVLSGETNEGIAESLFLSRRTVENHLYRIYQSLDVKEGRESLVGHLGWITR